MVIFREQLEGVLAVDADDHYLPWASRLISTDYSDIAWLYAVVDHGITVNLTQVAIPRVELHYVIQSQPVFDVIQRGRRKTRFELAELQGERDLT